MRTRTKVVLGVLASGILACGLLGLWRLTFSGENAVDPRNPRWVLWKWGLAPFPKDLALGVLHRDMSALEGMTLAELESTFGDMRMGGGLTAYQRRQSEWMEPGDRAWIGDTGFCVTFRSGRVVRVNLYKG